MVCITTLQKLHLFILQVEFPVKNEVERISTAVELAQFVVLARNMPS